MSELGGAREAARLVATVYPALSPNFGRELSSKLMGSARHAVPAKGWAGIAAASGSGWVRGFAGAIDKGNRIIDGAVRGVAKGVTGVLGVAGVAAGGAIVKGITGGFRRLKDLQVAEKRFDNMGLSVKQVDKLVSGLNDKLLDTPYALNEGATSITSFVGANMELDKVTERFGLLVDTAAFAESDLSEVGHIFTKIATEGKLTGRTLNQLAVRGVPALALLADAAGVSGEEMRDMISSSAIDTETFFELWEKGAQGFGENNIRIAGSAKSMGETVSGAWRNMGTAMSRTGALWLDESGTFDLMHTLFSSIRATLNELNPLIERAGKAFGGWLDNIGAAAWLESLPEKVKSFVDGGGLKGAGKEGSIFGGLGGAATGVAAAGASKMIPFAPKLAAGPLALVGAFAGLVATTPELRDLLKELWAALVPIVEKMGTTLFHTFMQLAEVALPLLIGVLEVAVDVVKWLGDNADWIVPILLTVMGVIKLLTIAQWLWNAAMFANPIGLIILAIVALVGAFIWLWNNVDGFRNFWVKAWDMISGAAVWVWERVLRPAFHWIANVGVPAVAAAATWLWQSILKPAWEGIAATISWAWQYVIRPVWTAIEFYITRILIPTFRFLWENVVQPIWRFIGAYIKFVWENVIRPVWNVIHFVITRVLAPVFRWLWENVIQLAWRNIAAIIEWAWQRAIKPTWDALVAFIRNVIAPVVKWLWESAVKPTWEAISKAIELAWKNAIKPTWDALVGAIKVVGDWFNRLWTDWVKPIVDRVVDKFHDFRDASKKAWESIKDTAEEVWKNIANIIRKPINWVIGTVYTKGIKNLVEGVAKKIGLKIELPTIPTIPEFHSGGWVNGSGEVLAKLLGDERVLSHAEIASAGGPSAVDRMFDSGGGRRPGTGAPWDDVVDWMTRPIRSVADAVSEVAKGFAAPVVQAAMDRLITPLWDSLDRSIREAFPANAAKAFVDKLLDGILAWFQKDDDKYFASAPGGFDTGTGSSALLQAMAAFVRSVAPGMRVTSGYRAGDPGYHGRSRAIDMGFSDRSEYSGGGQARRAANAIRTVFGGSTLELIWDFLGANGVWNGRPHRFTGPSAGPGTHNDHIHWAFGGSGADIQGRSSAANRHTLPGQGGDPGGGWRPGYMTHYWAGDAEGTGWTTASGRRLDSNTIAMRHMPLGTRIALAYGNRRASGTVWDFGPSDFVQARRPGEAIVDLATPLMRRLTGGIGNVQGQWRATSLGAGRTYRGYRARGYDKGGWLSNRDIGFSNLDKPEAVLTDQQLTAMTAASTRPIVVQARLYIDGKWIDARIETTQDERDERLVQLLESR